MGFRGQFAQWQPKSSADAAPLAKAGMILPLKKFFSKSRMRIPAGMGKFAEQVTVISMTWVGG
jgi:hypothetical protein